MYLTGSILYACYTMICLDRMLNTAAALIIEPLRSIICGQPVLAGEFRVFKIRWMNLVNGVVTVVLPMH
jgi:hypothetical protein